MKVLFVTHYNDMLGANRSMVQLIRELMAKGVDPTVLLPPRSKSDKPDLGDYLSKLQIPFVEAPIRIAKHNVNWKCPLNYIYGILRRNLIIEAIESLEFDIVHSNSSVIDIGSFIANKQRVKHVWHLREFGDLDYNLKTPFGKWFQKYFYGKNSDFIAISQKIFNHFSKYIPTTKLHLIYNGIPATLKYKEQSPGEAVNFCIVGLIHPNKRQIDALRAVDILVNRRGITSLHLSLIGKWEETYKNYLCEFIKSHNLDTYITFTGQLDNVNDSLKTMNVGIMSSSNEAFGRVTVEYMMNSLAVIASDGGANQEIIDDNLNGMIYPATDYIALADKMETLIENQSLLLALSKNGYEKATSTFSSTKNSDAIFNLYQQILNK